MNTQQILIVEDDINSSKVLARILTKEGYIVDTVSNAEDAYTMIVGADYDLLIIDMVLPNMDGLSFLKKITKEYPDILTLMVTAYGSITTAVEALKAGANDFLEKPLVPEKLLHVLHKVFEEQRLKNEINALKSDLMKRNQFANIIGSHPKMQIIFQLIESLKDTDVAVLITGETGTGKELVARAIHFQSHRRHQPFMAINCASVPETLFESELFGYERGAFTGAGKRKLGKLEQAQGGTVLLDEIGDMPMSVQGKLLRSLQEKKIERLGSNKAASIPLNVRILSATNKDLYMEVSQKNFRMDLFYRLNVVPIHIPPLRERIEDVPLLVEHFLNKISKDRGEPLLRISEKALSRLMSHPWPGNVREFENVMERAAVLNPGRVIEDIPFLPVMQDPETPSGPPSMEVNPDHPLKTVCSQALAEIEKDYLNRVLQKYKGSIKLTAEHAQINVRTVRRKMKEYGLDKWEFK
ncbi:sigma-54-dependent transcriptional regulator [Desulfospira joergensenii]|uniref:sigma-54-dependent transcriptional regulator n=1 Tax=Desulfospira joergensenii TaxID=53329 RepID=UPI0003B7B99E|nr:sigma-54 dependent transcriptional regulator [Desulfospira joergensenii]